MNAFDVWLRKRAAIKPHLYGPQLASEGREMVEESPVVPEAPQEPKKAVVVRQEAAVQVPMDFKSRAAGEDAEEVEDGDYE